MATALNTYNCITSGGNTGVGQCSLDIKNIIGAILLPSGTTFSANNVATVQAFVAALQAATLAAPNARAYPIHDFETATDNSEDVTIQTLGYGGKYPVREGSFDWSFQFIKGGLCLAKALRKFNDRNVDVLFVDAQFMVIGLKVGTGLRGIPQNFVYNNGFTLSTGDARTAYVQRFSFQRDFIDSIGFVKLDYASWAGILGLQDVVLASGGARVANVALVTGSFSCAGGGDLYDVYDNELAVANLWRAYAPNGNALTITSVAQNANIKGWTVTVDTADADYAAGNPITLSLAPADVLNGAGILAIESNTFTTPN